MRKRQKVQKVLRALKNFLYLLSIISGLLLSLAFCNIGLEWLIWFSLIPFLIVIEKENNIKRLIIEAFLCGLVFYSITLYWLYYVTILGLILLIGYLIIYFILFSLILKFLYKAKAIRFFSQLFVIPSLWVILEYLRSHLLFSGFGWVSLGYSQYQNLSFIQIATWTGVYGLSFLIVLINVAMAELILNIKAIVLFNKKYLKKTSIVVLISVLSLLLVYIYGDIKLDNPLEGKKLKVSVIQGNVPQCQKWEPFYRNLILEKYKKLTKMASFDSPDIIIWPETSLPGYLRETDLLKQMSKLAKDIKTPILLGVATQDRNEKRFYNSAAIISNKGKVGKIYNKIHLVPFGEYTPLPFIFGFSKDIYKIADWTKGRERILFNVRNEKFGVLICFEDIFSDFVRNFVKDGVDFMVNVSNDAWFMHSTEPYQHLQTSVFRAAENRINLIRASNTGISCFIDPYGRITKRVSSDGEDIFIEGYQTQAVYIQKIRTFYTKFGDIFVLICLSLILAQTTKALLQR